ncbi:MAG: type II secretion system protein [bacterium]
MKRKVLFKKGISLVETLVAVGIMAMLMLAVSSMLMTTSNGEKRNRVISEVEFQATAIIDKISQSIRNASSITTPVVGASSTTLTLDLTSVPSDNPTVYSIDSNTLLVSKGGGPASSLVGSIVKITDLSFQNISAVGSKGAVRVSMKISSVNPNNIDYLNYNTERITTVTLR